MVDFLNNFSNSCSHRLFVFDRKIDKIEAELRLLEIKLNSIPGFRDEKPPAPAQPQQDVKPADVVPLESEEPHNEDVNEPETPAVDPALLKYIKMVQVGVPVPAVKQKMQAEGLDPELLKM